LNTTPILQIDNNISPIFPTDFEVVFEVTIASSSCEISVVSELGVDSFNEN
jgi:hypothetical protein